MAEPQIFRDVGASAIEAAIEALAAGQLVVLPTDTVYGLAGDPRVEGATRAIFEAKGRPRELTLPVLVPDADRAREIAAFDVRAEALAATYWPGGLTLVLPRTLSALWDLGEESQSVGVRMPDHPVALSVLERTGPLAVTSANRSGDPTPSTCNGVVAELGEAVAVYVCGGPRPGGTASTVVDLTGPKAAVLRPGAVPTPDIERAVRES